MSRSTCKGCGKVILWAEDKNGKKIPLDPIPPVYRFNHDQVTGRVVCDRDENAAVSHFITCPDRDKFSGSNKQKGFALPYKDDQ